MSRVLVTGGAGFIGRHVVEAALSAGWQVRLLDSFRHDVHVHPSAEFGDPERLEVLLADVTDGAAVDQALADVDVVCHQAAKVGLGVDFADAPDYVHSNLTGTAVLLAAMAKRGIDHLVLASSMVVYGEGCYLDEGALVRPGPRTEADLAIGRFEPLSRITGKPLEPTLVPEEAALDPRNVYAATKVGQEHLVALWARECGGRAALLRYHNVYGPGMPQDTPYAGVAALFCSALAHGRAPRVFEDGRQRRDFIHVRDVAAANLAALDWVCRQDPAVAAAFNLGSGQVRTIGELAEALSRAMGGPAPIMTGEYRLGDVRHITADSARARVELGWQPTIEFTTGLAELAAAQPRVPGEEDEPTGRMGA